MEKRTIFNQNIVNHLEQPLFLGAPTGVARYEEPKHPFIDMLTQTQLGFFWQPQEVSLQSDRLQYQSMSAIDQFIFTQNLKYQTLLDSVQGRAPSEAFLDLCSDQTLETWIATWTWSETIHSRSYTHIMRNVYPNPSKEFDEIVLTPAIMKRATEVTKYYDTLIRAKNTYQNTPKDSVMYHPVKMDLMKWIYLTLMSVNVLEAIRFYVSFSCSFNFAEHGIMEGNAKIIRLIARDEQLHLEGTQFIIKRLQSGEEGELWKQIVEENKELATKIFVDSVEQEKEWIDYLFSYGTTKGLNHEILKQYVEYLANQRMPACGLKSPYKMTPNPIPWINKWLNSDDVQVAPQEVELSAYLISATDNDISDEETLNNFKNYETTRK